MTSLLCLPIQCWCNTMRHCLIAHYATTPMKLFQFLLGLYACFSLSSAWAQAPQEQVTLDSLHKQLITIVESELAENKELDQTYASRLKSMVPVWREIPTRTSIQGRLQQLSAYLNQSNASQKTKDAVDACIAEIGEYIEKQNKQMAEDIRKTTGETLRRMMKTNDPEEIRKQITEYKDYRTKASQREFREEHTSSAEASSASQFMNYWLSFHNYRVEEQLRYAAGQINQLEGLSSNMSWFLSTDEFRQLMQDLRKSLGLLQPNELEALWHQTLQELLDDANQDHLDELLLKVNKCYQIAQASSPNDSRETRWQWLESLARRLNESVQRCKEGGAPGFSVYEFSRNNSSGGVVVKKEEFHARLSKYFIRSTDDKGNATSLRLFYDEAELKTIAEGLLARVLDDANQDKLPELQLEIKRMRSYASSESYSGASTLSAKFERMTQLARTIHDNVSTLKVGGNNQLNLSQLYNDYSDGIMLLSKKDLLEKSKKYMVNVQQKDGTQTKLPLYLDAEELFQKINRFEELPALLSEITRASSQVTYENGVSPLAGLLPRVARCSELAGKLASGESFMMQTTSSSYYYSDSSRPTPTTGPIVEKINRLESQIEWALIRRFFPGEDATQAEDQDQTINALMAKFRDQKNYQAMLHLYNATQSIKPSRQLLSQTQAQAIRDYLNGVRQQEVFEQSRLAVFYLQKAATSSATVIDAQQLKTRLQQLRKKSAEDYQKGIDDALRSPAADATPREIEVPAAAK
jgi:hypothetical protein